jgi:hypothetical protein
MMANCGKFFERILRQFKTKNAVCKCQTAFQDSAAVAGQ